jgi:hypothetical protein
MSKTPIPGVGRSPASPPTNKPTGREQSVVGQLNERYKEFAALWESVEERLQRFRIAKDVSVHLRDETEYHDNDGCNPTGDHHSHYLGFARCVSGWRVCYGISYSRDPSGEIGWKPVAECRLETRLEVIPHLDKLREKVVQAAEETVPQLDDALAKLRDTLKNW